MRYIILLLFRIILSIIIYTFKYIIIPFFRALGIFIIYIYYFDIDYTKRFIDNLYYIDSSYSKHSCYNIYTKSMFHFTPTILFKSNEPFFYKNIFSFILDKRIKYKRIVFNDSDTVNLSDTYIHPDIFEELKNKYNWNNVKFKS